VRPYLIRLSLTIGSIPSVIFDVNNLYDNYPKYIAWGRGSAGRRVAWWFGEKPDHPQTACTHRKEGFSTAGLNH
jgi:hypothetical protein